MNQPSREEVESFITALNYGMKVSHKPEFLIALAEGWLKQHAVEKETMRPTKARNECDHVFETMSTFPGGLVGECVKCRKIVRELC